MEETFYLGDTDARGVGIRLQKPLEFTAAVPAVSSEHVAGRNGDLLHSSGEYKNRQGTAKCFALKENVLRCMDDIHAFLFASHSYRKLSCSDDPEHFWLARVANGPKLEQRMRFLAPFEIKFDCKPQRFLVDGENTCDFAVPSSIWNPTGFSAMPLIEVYGTGPGNLTVGGITVEIKALEDRITLDSELGDAYRRTEDGALENKNSCIYAPVFPELLPGENVISWDGGITSVVITPRWWTL